MDGWRLTLKRLVFFFLPSPPLLCREIFHQKRMDIGMWFCARRKKFLFCSSPNHQRWHAKRTARSEHVHVAHTFLHVWASTCMLSRRLSTKFLRRRLCRKFIKSVLLVGTALVTSGRWLVGVHLLLMSSRREERKRGAVVVVVVVGGGCRRRGGGGGVAR